MSVSDTVIVIQNSIPPAFVDIICREKTEIQTFTHQSSITVESKTNLFYWKFLLDSHFSSGIRSNLNIMVPGEENDSPPNILAWEIPWTQEPGGLQSMELKRVAHDLATKQQLQISWWMLGDVIAWITGHWHIWQHFLIFFKVKL